LVRHASLLECGLVDHRSSSFLKNFHNDWRLAQFHSKGR
jgi:hypothetical protein